MLRIEISNRHYNGDFGVGSVFEEKYLFEIEENVCYSNSIKSFCNNEDFGGNILSNVNVSIPFILKENDIQKLNNVTSIFKIIVIIYIMKVIIRKILLILIDIII